MNLEWTIPFLLTTPYGPLPFNQPLDSGDAVWFNIDETKSSMGPLPLRVSRDDVPQSHGSILHRDFKPGYSITLNVQFWELSGPDGKPACDALLREMQDFLMANLDSLINPSDAALGAGQARLQWTPSGYIDDRLVDKLQLGVLNEPVKDGPLWTMEFTLYSPFPYAIDLTQSDDTIADTPGSTTLTNLGNTEFWPVFKVHGPFAGDSFIITNETTGLYFVYDIALPGSTVIASGHYAEIDTFRNTMYLDGASANLKPGLDVEQSDFWSLIPGPNQLSFDGPGGTCEILWNHAWVS